MESLNLVERYNADPTGDTDSWEPIQKTLDDASNLGRALNAHGDADRNIVMLDSNINWRGFSPDDAGQAITIEANVGLQPGQYYLVIDEVLSPTQCTVRSANGSPLTFVSGFTDTQVIWQRGGQRGHRIGAPSGKYSSSKPLEIVGSHVGLIGEGGDPYSEHAGTRFQFSHFGPGFIEQPFIGKDTYWKLRGEPLIATASSSYRLPDPQVFWDYNDVPHLQLGLKDAEAFTIEFYIKPNVVAPNGHQILAYAGALAGGASEVAMTFFMGWTSKWSATVNLGGTPYTVECPIVPTAGGVYHLALQFQNGELGLFVNGVYHQGNTNIGNKKLTTLPYQLFGWGGYRMGFPFGGQVQDALDCCVSHLRVSKVARYSTSGFTPAFDVPAVDGYTMLLDEGNPSQEKLFTVSLGGFNHLAATTERTLVIKHGGGGWAFHTGHRLEDFSVYAYGCPLWQHQVIGNSYADLSLRSWNVALASAGDTFNNRYRRMALSGSRCSLASSGPGGICTYQDIGITGGGIGAWLASGSGVVSNWYIHGTSHYQLVFDLWEGSGQGVYFSNEDVNASPDFKGNLVIGRDSDITMIASKFETYASPVPSVIIGNARSATIINGMFEPHADATEVVKFIDSPKSKVVLVNPNHGRYEGQHPQTDVPWSVSAPSGKLEVIP